MGVSLKKEGYVPQNKWFHQSEKMDKSKMPCHFNNSWCTHVILHVFLAENVHYSNLVLKRESNVFQPRLSSFFETCLVGGAIILKNMKVNGKDHPIYYGK